MVMSNLGTIILSLPSISSLLNANDLSTDTITSHQVRLLSVSNTAARIILGPLADLVSPVALSINDATQRRHRVSRVVFLSGPALLLSLTFFWMEFGVRCQEAAWALRRVHPLLLRLALITVLLQHWDRYQLRWHLYCPVRILPDLGILMD